MSWKRIFDLFLPESSISYKSLYSSNKSSSSSSSGLKSQYGSQTYQAKTQDMGDTISQARNDLLSGSSSSNSSNILEYLDKMDEINSWWNKTSNGQTSTSSIFDNLFSGYSSNYWTSPYTQDWSSWLK